MAAAASLLRPLERQGRAVSVLVSAVLAFAGAAAGLELMLCVVRQMAPGLLDARAARVWVACATGVSSAVLALFATGARSVPSVAARSFVALPLAVLNTIVCLFGVFCLQNGWSLESARFCLFVGGLYGVLIGMPLGVGLGVAYAVPILFLVHVRRDGAPGGLERVLLHVGVWAMIVGGNAFVFGLLRGAWDGALAADGGVLALGAAIAGVSVVRRAMRARWLRAVARDEVAGWRIVRCGHLAWSREDATPFSAEPRSGCNALLVRVEAADGAPYRTTTGNTVVALLRTPL